MYESKFSFGAASSESMKKETFKNSIFLEEKYDSAIMGVNYMTDSIIYSLDRLIYLEMEKNVKEGLADDLRDPENLYLASCIFIYSILKKSRDINEGVPPTLLSRCEKEDMLVA
jgi:hypothetical protein